MEIEKVTNSINYIPPEITVKFENVSVFYNFDLNL